ncbi:MAG: class I SAM-dependent methyltransferase [Acetobacteraceae bacterium]
MVLSVDNGLDDRVSHEAAAWAIRLFLGREPLNEEEIEFHRAHDSLYSLRAAFSRTGEFKKFYERLRASSESWAAPLFLLEPPHDERITTRFQPPNLSDPSSQLCTESQFKDPLYSEFCKVFGIDPTVLHRKQWEWIWIAAVLKRCDYLRKGIKGLGFGVGQEPLPAFFARSGIQVLATDAPPAAIEGHGWESTRQHAASLEPLRRPELLRDQEFDKLVGFQVADMNHISTELRGFDFCWSSCCFEHLGSIEHGLTFVEESLKTLKPGGLAIHTTEFNVSSNQDTFIHPALSLFRKQDIEALYISLISACHKTWPLNFHPGTGLADAYIDLPPWGLPHLKLELAAYVTSSIGLVIEKKS